MPALGAGASVRGAGVKHRFAFLAALALCGCDQGEPKLEAPPGPPLHAVAIHPPVNAGLDCTPAPADSGAADCGVPLNTVFEIRFDRYLMPSTAVRQSSAGVRWRSAESRCSSYPSTT